jgi:molybdopterin synthase catalytic subunit
MSAIDPIRVQVRLFAMQREAAGTKLLSVELPPGATVEDAWATAVDAVPKLAAGRASLRFAVNGSYTSADTPLSDGDEVACIPPVSGGSGEGDGTDGPGRILEIRAAPLEDDLVVDLSRRVATVEDGALVVFVGRTRVTPGTPAPGQEAEARLHAGRDVEELEYEAFEPMALGILGDIAGEIEGRFGVRRLAIVHRTGVVPLGEASIVVVAAAPHRDAAFEAARYAIDETKARAPIWKSERFRDGHVWIGDPARTGPSEHE